MALAPRNAAALHSRAMRLLPLVLLIACGTPSYPTPTVDCQTDDDCALDDVSRDCCGHLCGAEPPWIAINRKSRAAIMEAQRARCEGKRLDCPVASCVAPPACKANPKAVCQAGRCVARVELSEACGQDECPASCGAQPAAAPAGKEAACAYALENVWVHCCCMAMGSGEAFCQQNRPAPALPEQCRTP